MKNKSEFQVALMADGHLIEEATNLIGLRTVLKAKRAHRIRIKNEFARRRNNKKP